MNAWMAFFLFSMQFFAHFQANNVYIAFELVNVDIESFVFLCFFGKRVSAFCRASLRQIKCYWMRINWVELNVAPMDRYENTYTNTNPSKIYNIWTVPWEIRVYLLLVYRIQSYIDFASAWYVHYFLNEGGKHSSHS